MREDEIPIETFDAMLRDLLTWRLVVEGDGDDAGTGNWQLVERAQRRLGELSIVRGPWPTERTAYPSRRCAECHQRQLTWLRDGSYVCDPCWQRRLAPAREVPMAASSPTTGPPRWVRLIRQTIALMG